MIEELRNLQDAYDKLDSHNKQLTTNHDMLKFLNEDLKHEIEEREEDIKRLNTLVNRILSSIGLKV